MSESFKELPPMWSPQDQRQALVEAALRSGAYNSNRLTVATGNLQRDVEALEKFIKEAKQ